MKQLVIKDNQCRLKSDFDEVGEVTSRVVDRTLAELEKEDGNIMGFLGAGDQRIIMESRFSRGEGDYFFQ